LGTQNATAVMLIACPSCSTSYNIEPASLGSAGRTVRCARCKTTWFADGSAPEPVAAEAEAQDVRGVLPPDDVPAPAAAGEVPPEHDVSVEAEPAEVAPDRPPPVPAQPIAIVDAPSLVPPAEPPPLPDAGSDTDEAENFAARRKRLQARRKQARQSSRWTALILVLFAFNVALVGARSEVVRFLPQTASLFSAIGLPVNLRNLKFENMKISKDTQESLSSLVIEGTIVSVSSKPRRRSSGRRPCSQAKTSSPSATGPARSSVTFFLLLRTGNWKELFARNRMRWLSCGRSLRVSEIFSAA